MSSWEIRRNNSLSKHGYDVIATVHSLEYNGTWMGECFVSTTVKSPNPIEFKIGDYIEYRNEKFYINYDPAVIKRARRGTYGEGFSYDNIKFNSVSDELTRCKFKDVVLYDDPSLHYTSLPTFSFYAETVRELADRLQANLNRLYTANPWNVKIHMLDGTWYNSNGNNVGNGNFTASNFPGKVNIEVQVSDQYCWDALALVRNSFGLNFVIRNREIIIDSRGSIVGEMAYGKGNGLKEIEKTVEPDQQIITRLHAYGSTKNLPWRYYHREGSDLPNNMAVDRLMLPSFPDNPDPYIDADPEVIAQLGIREGVVFFDTDNEDDGIIDIYPSLEEMTAGDAGVSSLPADTRLDVIVSSEMDDLGTGIPEKEGDNITPAQFSITVHDLGFDLKDTRTKNAFNIVMKDGMCGSMEFEVVSVEKVLNDWKLICNRKEETSIRQFFPNAYNKIMPGDHFVLTEIELPDVYIQAASNKLLRYATEYLKANCSTRYTYTPKVDDIWMARQHDHAIENGEISYHDTIKEGDLITFHDEDLGLEDGTTITIDQLTIKEGESLIPQYTIVLKEEKTVGTIQKMQNQINSIALNGGGGGGVSASDIRPIGETLFLSKKHDDTTQGAVTSQKGFYTEGFQSGLAGDGAGVFKGEDGSHIETDYLDVRRTAYFRMLTISEVKHIGGELILSAAACQVSEVSRHEDPQTSSVDYYRCYFDKEVNGKVVYNEWEVGDQAYCATFEPKKGASEAVKNHFYWRLIVGKGEEEGRHYIDLSNITIASGSDTPSVNDNIVLLGSRNKGYRQTAQVYSTVEAHAPSRKYYAGIDNFSLEGKAVETLEWDSATSSPHWNIGGEGNNSIDFKEGKLKIVVGDSDIEETLGDKFYTYIEDEHDSLKDANGNIVETMTPSQATWLPSYGLSDEELAEMEGSFLLTRDGIAYKLIIHDGRYSWQSVNDTYLIQALNTANANSTWVQKFENGEYKNFVKSYNEEAGVVVTSQFAGLLAQSEVGGVPVSAAMGTFIVNEDGRVYSEAFITADQIDLSAKAMNFEGDQITISTDNFVLDNKGNVSITGKITASLMIATERTLYEGKGGGWTGIDLINYPASLYNISVPSNIATSLPSARLYAGTEIGLRYAPLTKGTSQPVHLIGEFGDLTSFGMMLQDEDGNWSFKMFSSMQLYGYCKVVAVMDDYWQISQLTGYIDVVDAYETNRAYRVFSDGTYKVLR